ncbi:Down syndrome cell adhesion molecule-like protein Dscam2 [Orchesella cincta]|uniref:Down syndrome cell adhesion molecule-like protein Dscam2 n=1 Tax=Orchesella cincta TaxID=48709 RepID=A0A1D2N561_ORCCI|nr:Down syndrome cell adhesion molecule-like protein Dscam2 [Orchesella cincta]
MHKSQAISQELGKKTQEAHHLSPSQLLSTRVEKRKERMGHPSNKWREMMVQLVFFRVRLLLLLLLALYGLVTDWMTLLPRCNAEIYDSEGPQFISEPSRLNYFTNIQGLLLHCSARGSPSPRIHWINQKDGQPVELVSGVRELYPNGTMYFPPFAVSYYRPDIHDQVYVCIGLNSVGKIRSRDIHVRAVINQQFDVRVESAYTSEGNDALLRCVVPDPVKDYVSVTSWIKDSSLNIFPPHSGGGGRYFMAPSGELLIEDVSRNDSSSAFRCRTVNRLTDETQLSENSARLQLKGGPPSNSPPRILSRISRVRLKEGDVGVIFCLSEGHPPPNHGWLKLLNYGGLEPLRPSERVRIRRSAIIFENVIASDVGTYVCVANNTSGSDRYRIEVVVTRPLEVQVVPSVLTVDIGKSAELTCWTNRASDLSSSSQMMTTSNSQQQMMHHQQPSAITVTWRKDGTEIRPSLRISFSPSGDKLKIVTVQREDKGIYQCFVKSDSDMAQATAELRLGDSHPQLIYRFIEQTLRPGTAVSIKCSATGNPTPHISWLLDGFPLPHSERLLIGQYVTMNGDVVSHVNITSTSRVGEDGGEFQCLATNKLGFTAHSARLNIYGAPFVRNMPNTMTAVAGKLFLIKCPVSGYPISSITWEKDEQLLPSTIRQTVSQNGTLTIRDVDRGVDSGWYTCTASNKQGSSNRRGVHINVVVPPKLVPFSFPEVTREGERIFVTCVVSDGDPPIKLQWLKDSVPIHAGGNSSRPFDMSTHQIGDFDALALQIPHVNSNDTGNYSCNGYNAAGHASHTLQLIVHVPPRIAPYSFPSPVSQGSRVQVVCSVEQGDIEETNLTVAWLKDMEPIRSSGGSNSPLLPPSSSSSLAGNPQQQTTTNAKVMQVDAYSAILIIDRVDSERDSGNFTCKISNSVDEVTKTNELVVRVPPKWVDEPKDTEVVEGKSFTIPCQAKGFPTPKISWKRAMSDRPENFRDIPEITSSSSSLSVRMRSGGYQQQQQMTGSDLMMGASANSGGGGVSSSVSTSVLVDPFSFSNGTLSIHSTRKSHHGYYLCEASNGIASGLSKVIRLVVNVPVRIKEPQQNVSSPVGGNAVLQCEISGDPPLLAVGWKKGLEEIKPDLADSRYRVRVLNNSGTSTVSELTVTNVGRDDTARYTCFASNRHGESQGAILLYVQEPPDVPRNLHVIAKGSRLIRLGWILTQNGNSPLKQFIVQHKLGELAGETQESRVSGNVFSETIRKLRPATSYVFTVIAENEVGKSEPSEGLEIKTDGEAPEGKARNVRVAAVSSSDIQVTWEHPEKDTWHGQLLGYYVGYMRYREGEQYQFSTIERKEPILQEFLISGLVPFTSYEIVLQAYNGIGTGPMSDAMVATTLEDVPNGAPEGIQCSPLTSDNLQLSWNPVTGEHARGLIKGYRVTLEQVDADSLDGNGDTQLIRTTGTTNLIVNGLAKYTNYSIQVQAFTAVGNGPPSSPTYCQTEEDVPNSPAAIKAVVSSSSSITVSWQPPQEPNGQLTKYTLYISVIPDASQTRRDGVGLRKRTVPPETNKFQFEGLRPDEKYEFRVSASTRVGEGAYAITQRIQTKSVVSSIISFGEDLRIVWKTDVRFVCEIVGNSIIQWTKFSEVVRESDRTTINRDGSLVIREARRADMGNYTCTINVNNGHTGVDSITHKLTVQVPPLAPLMTAAGTSYSTVNLQWKLSDSGGAPVKGYVLHVKASDEWIERRLSRHLSAHELQGLECGTYYQMYLTASNRAGMGRASEMVNVSTLGSIPTLKLHSPQFMAQSNRTVTRVLLKDVWSGNGFGGGEQLGGERHSVDLTGLKSSSTFHIRVIATNSAGTAQTEITVNTPSAASSNGLGAETSTNVMNQLKSTPFYMDVKLMGPIFLSIIALIVVTVSACVCYRRKSPADGQSNENLSVGTPSSSLYFKQNHQALLQQPHLRNSQQMYMTVKKSTPMKGVDVSDLDTIPQYADDIYPYATFEVNEPHRDTRACSGGVVGVPTLDRKRASGRPSSGCQDNMKPTLPPHHLQQQQSREESDEYDSYGSDSDFTDKDLPSRLQQQGGNKSRYVLNMGKNAAVVRQQQQKFQDYDSHARCGNRYEFGPPQNNPALLKYHHDNGSNSKPGGIIRPLSQNDEMIHGMITSEPYAFNDSYPTALVQDKRGSGKKKSGKRKFHSANLQPYVSSSELSELLPAKYTLDPPEGFSDTLKSKPEDTAPATKTDLGMKSHNNAKPQRTQMKTANEYAIAV